MHISTCKAHNFTLQVSSSAEMIDMDARSADVLRKIGATAVGMHEFSAVTYGHSTGLRTAGATWPGRAAEMSAGVGGGSRAAFGAHACCARSGGPARASLHHRLISFGPPGRRSNFNSEYTPSPLCPQTRIPTAAAEWPGLLHRRTTHWARRRGRGRSRRGLARGRWCRGLCV